MKIAYLISAYKDPQQLGRMLRTLQGEGTHFFVHLDKKADMARFKAQITPPYGHM